MNRVKHLTPRHLIILLFISILTSITACKKGAFDWLQPVGKTVEKTVGLSSFQALLLTADVDVVFHKVSSTDSCKVVFEAGENVIDQVAFSFEKYVQEFAKDTLIIGGDTSIYTPTHSYKRLIINNESLCKGLKKIDLYFDTLANIEYRSNGSLKFRNPIDTDTLMINIYEGSGTISLWVEGLKWSSLNFHFGTAELFAKGDSKINYIYQASYGPIDARNLQTDFSFLENRSDNHCWVRVNNSLEAKINGNGNVYYYAPNPDIVQLSGTGNGKLLYLGN